jgi:hypothetical protein
VEVNAAFKIHRHRHCTVVTDVGGLCVVTGFADDAVPRFGDSEEGHKTLPSRHVRDDKVEEFIGRKGCSASWVHVDLLIECGVSERV